MRGYCFLYLRSRVYCLNFFLSPSNGEVNEKGEGGDSATLILISIHLITLYVHV